MQCADKILPVSRFLQKILILSIKIDSTEGVFFDMTGQEIFFQYLRPFGRVTSDLSFIRLSRIVILLCKMAQNWKALQSGLDSQERSSLI
jgi:hypothetical protein